eukprot:15366477-Alexandrium_andersonii.AAC.1
MHARLAHLFKHLFMSFQHLFMSFLQARLRALVGARASWSSFHQRSRRSLGASCSCSVQQMR